MAWVVVCDLDLRCVLAAGKDLPQAGFGSEGIEGISLCETLPGEVDVRLRTAAGTPQGDDPVNRLVATRLLERAGCEVQVAKDGREAVALSQTDDYRVIFMDCQMPELDSHLR